jgi:ATP-binding cassette subfamily B protein
MAMTTTSLDLKSTISSNRLAGLWRMMADFRLTYFGAILSLGLSTAAKTATFFLIRYLVDDVLGRPDLGRLLPGVALGFIGLALLEGVFTFLSGWLASRTAEGIALRLRNYLFDHLQRLSFTYHDRTPTGDLIQRASSDVDAVRRFFADQAIGIGRIGLLFAVNWIALWNLNTQLALFSVIVVPLVLLMSVFFFKRVSKVYEHYQEQDAILSTTLQENLTGVRVVKAFARQGYEREKFERDNWEKFQRGKRLLMMHSLFWPSADILCAGQMLAGFTVGALMVINGAITLGDYLAYMGLVVLLIWPMRELGRMIVQASTGMVSYGRVAEIIREEREPIEEGAHQPPQEDRVRGEIEFRGVGFEYEAESRVLRDITLSVKPGEVVALLGPTGSGKTSLVNLLPRFYDYTSGSLTLDDVELKHYSRQYLRRQIGIVEQEPFLFSRTIRENIT